MPQTIQCRDGSVWIDERLTVEEWVAQQYGEDVIVLGLALSEESLIATISYPESIFPNENVRVKFVPVPDDVLFKLTQAGGDFVKTYFADREKSANRVFVFTMDGKNKSTVELDLSPSKKIMNHSPTGFEWAYAGSGPAQLALAILFDVTGDAEIAQRHHQDFKNRFIANLKVDKWTIHEDDVKQWLKNAEEGVLL